MNMIASNILIDNFKSLENTRKDSDECHIEQLSKTRRDFMPLTFRQNISRIFNSVMMLK